MTLVENRLYVDGRRIADPPSLQETAEAARASGALAWLGLYRPDDDELQKVAREFGLHPLAVEDALHGHQRAKLEKYGDMLFVVLRPARYLDDTETVELGELFLFVGPDYVITVRHAESPDLRAVRDRLEAEPELLAAGPGAILYAVLDETVDEVEPVLAGLENDLDEIEDVLFGPDGDRALALARRIYLLAREVMNLQRALSPLDRMIETLLAHEKLTLAERRRRGDALPARTDALPARTDALPARPEAQGERGDETRTAPSGTAAPAGAVDDVEVSRGLRDVLDHVIRADERVAAMRSTLENALTVHSTLVGQSQNETSLQQNDQMKKISAWAGILFVPSLVGAIYGMNFAHMPELSWQWGYPFALGVMVVAACIMYVLFKRKDWL